MPRYVVLKHIAGPSSERDDHFDFMFESTSQLWTYAVNRIPESGGSVNAQRLADHQPKYLDYQGLISGGRGEVIRIDHGQYDIVNSSEQSMRLRVTGQLLTGELLITKIDDDMFCLEYNGRKKKADE